MCQYGSPVERLAGRSQRSHLKAGESVHRDGAPPETARRSSAPAAKGFTEGVGAVVTHVQGDIGNAGAGGVKAAGSIFHTAAKEVLAGALTGTLPEDPLEVVGREAGHRRQASQIPGAVQLPVDLKHHPLDAVVMVFTGLEGCRHLALDTMWPASPQ